MKEIQIFNNDIFGEIRTLEIEGGIYFVGNDIAKALGYKRPNDAITHHCRWAVKHRIPHPQSKTKTLEVNVIPEGDLYRLITNSELPTAQKFEEWVFDTVLPSIRKTGSYQPKLDTTDKLKIQEMNAKTRMANMYLKLSNVDTLSKEYKNILIAKATQTLSGEELLPLPKSQQKTYSATEIGNMFGVTPNRIGKIANANNLKTKEYGEWYRSKSEHCSKEVDTFKYYDAVIPKFKEILNGKVVVI